MSFRSRANYEVKGLLGGLELLGGGSLVIRTGELGLLGPILGK